MRYKGLLTSTTLSTYALSLLLSSAATAANVHVEVPVVRPKVVPSVVNRSNVVVVKPGMVRPTVNGSRLSHANVNRLLNLNKVKQANTDGNNQLPPPPPPGGPGPGSGPPPGSQPETDASSAPFTPKVPSR